MNCIKLFITITIALLSITYKTSAQENKIDTLYTKANSDGINLDVMILKKSNVTKKMPVLIFIVGSGEYSTMKSNSYFTSFYFNEKLLNKGFALVYFDKRGVGKSEGIWYETTFKERAMDVKNVTLKMQELDFVDTKKVFVAGHSQGGWIVQIVLSKYPNTFAGGISMAGPTFGVKKQLINDYKNQFLCKGYDTKKAERKAESRVKKELFFVNLFGRKGNLKQLKIIKDFEPKPYIENLNKPILFLFAENDPLVNPQWSIEELNSIFPKGLPNSMEYYIAEGENHSFQISPKCYMGKYNDLSYSKLTQKKYPIG